MYLSKCNHLVMQLVPAIHGVKYRRIENQFFSFNLSKKQTKMLVIEVMVIVNSEITVFADPACTVQATGISELTPALDTCYGTMVSNFFFGNTKSLAQFGSCTLLTVLEDEVEVTPAKVGGGPTRVSQLSFQHLCQPNNKIFRV